MVLSCCVPRCKNKSDKKSKISFHSFPRSESLRDLWILRVQRDEVRNGPVSKYMKVCSDHFTRDDFRSSYNGIYNGLNPNAVPSIFRKVRKRKRASGESNAILTSTGTRSSTRARSVTKSPLCYETTLTLCSLRRHALCLEPVAENADVVEPPLDIVKEENIKAEPDADDEDMYASVSQIVSGVNLDTEPAKDEEISRPLLRIEQEGIPNANTTMVQTCVVATCRNTATVSGVSFHSIPRNPTMRLEWAKRIRRDALKCGFNMRVCSAHFLETDYRVSYAQDYYKTLKSDAVPSVLLPPDPEDACANGSAQDSAAVKDVAEDKTRRNEAMKAVIVLVQKCRFCQGIKDNMSDLFQRSKAGGMPLAATFTSVFNVQVDRIEGKSERVCADCLAELARSLKFKHSIIEANRTSKKRIKVNPCLVPIIKMEVDDCTIELDSNTDLEPALDLESTSDRHYVFLPEENHEAVTDANAEKTDFRKVPGTPRFAPIPDASAVNCDDYFADHPPVPGEVSETPISNAKNSAGCLVNDGKVADNVYIALLTVDPDVRLNNLPVPNNSKPIPSSSNAISSTSSNAISSTSSYAISSSSNAISSKSSNAPSKSQSKRYAKQLVECDFCGKKIFKGRLRGHLETNIPGQRCKLSCRFCPMTFRNSGSLRNHAEKHMEPLVCTACGKDYVHSSVFEKHLRRLKVRGKCDEKRIVRLNTL